MKRLVRFFSSVKLAIVLIILLVAASIVGTLIPQGRDMAEYEARYGRMGAPLVRFQLTDVYRSVWFLTLMGLFGLNITACTLTRIGGKARRAFRPRVESDPKELGGYKIKDRLAISVGERTGKGTGNGRSETGGGAGIAVQNVPFGKSASSADEDSDTDLGGWTNKESDSRSGFHKIKTRAVAALKTAHYHVRTVEEKAAGRIHIYGRKRIDGIFGSDIVHLGLLVIIAGGIATGTAGFRADVTLNPGETRDVPRAGFAVRLERFDTEMYPGGGVKDWKSTVTVVEDGRDVRTQVVEVNHPLVHNGFSLYQMAYGTNWEGATLKLRVGKKGGATGAGEGTGGETSGAMGTSAAKTIKIKRGEVVSLGDEEGTEILVRQFLPDFVLGENNRPENRSLEPNNPAAYVELRREGTSVVEGWIFAAYPEISRLRGEAASEMSVQFLDLDAPEYSVLQAAKDPGVPLIWLGSILVMAGLGLAFYRPTWEIRMVIAAAADGKAEAKSGSGKAAGSLKIMVFAGGIAAKSRDGFEKEFARVMDEMKKT
ncbi:MAG: cytochrome c biogenesis protein ResB [Candidatus Aminicenantes bacterium]|nr:cytochrome c biogenesis protein ResB [Candidatus Aminicenantes bacterium]